MFIVNELGMDGIQGHWKSDKDKVKKANSPTHHTMNEEQDTYLKNTKNIIFSFVIPYIFHSKWYAKR